MCGIVGYIGEKEAAPILLEGLKRLEYRGYDSAGMAVLNGKSHLSSAKCAGKIAQLQAVLQAHPLKGTSGIGHTRWATHGRPNDENAHPHTDCTGKIAVVHNGIFENYIEVKEKLMKAGHVFKTETDTEIIPHLIETYYSEMSEPNRKSTSGLRASEEQAVSKKPRHKGNLEEAVIKALKEVRGSFAISVLHTDERDKVVAARMGCPLVIGLGKNETFLASDIPAFLPYTRDALVVDDGEVIVLKSGEVKLFSPDGDSIERQSFHVQWDAAMAEKGGYKHFMLKEIYEQPKVIADTLAGRLKERSIELEVDLPKKFNRIFFTAAGTAYHAAMVGKYWFETLAKIPAEVELSSEFRYRDLAITKDTLVVAISQSGETADTLAAIREAKKRGLPVMAITNVVGSSLAREVPSLFTRAGIEIGVAATKTFVAQLTALALLALKTAADRNTLDKEELDKLIFELHRIPELTDNALANDQEVLQVAKLVEDKKEFLFLGRHVQYPIALEGALKLKEISYLHAEGYAAGEMKHGPIALIDENVPVIALAMQSPVYEKVVSNIEEVRARKAPVIAIAENTNKQIQKFSEHALFVPQTHWLWSPILSVLPLQLLAYHIADRKGCDVDQPRNLAKSVTVE